MDMHNYAPSYTEGSRQSPIDIETSDITSQFVINDDPGFSLKCGTISYTTMRVINNVALEFDLEDEGQVYTSSLPSLFYPELEEPMTFTPKQIHFHMGKGTSADPGHGSEHSIDG